MTRVTRALPEHRYCVRGMLGKPLGPYRVDAELGSGGMGKVYAATVERSAAGLDVGTRVALKVVHSHLLETEGFFKRFLREADIGKQVEHENVVRTYDADALRHEGEDTHFLVMEYVEGQTLRELLAELDRVPEELCRHIGREVAKGLAAIHAAGVVHRDLKPENVLIALSGAVGPEHVVKVMDLGVARLTDEAIRLSQSGAFVGSLHYAAPEQFNRGGAEVDHRADLHALGLVLYELACGQHPFEHEDMRRVMKAVMQDAPRGVAEINPQLSPFFEEVVHKLLAKDRDARFQTATELSDVLEAGESGDWWKEHAKALRIETKQPLRRIHIPRETALYGRDDDLAKLRTLYDETKAGDGRVVLVEGEAGIGKTRLVDEFVGRLKQDGEDLNFLFGSYPPSGAATAAGALSSAYREQFGSAGLTEILRDYLPDTPLLIPAFAALLRGDAAPRDAEPLTKDSLQTVFVHATRALAAERPTIVLIDDLHFAPDDGRALFASLALAVPGHRVLLVGTTRPGLSEEWVAGVERQEHASQFTLARLGAKDLIRLLKDSFRSERLAHELAGRIAEKSDGNPFFVFEIIRGLREGQFITQREDGTWASTQVIDEIRIPSSVMDLIEARIVDLTEEERDLLDVAACCGFVFDPSLVADALGMRAIPAFKRLGRIEKTHRLVRSAGRDFAFDHHQVQEALYAGQPERLREEYHAAIAEALEARDDVADKDPSELDGALAVELCEHFFKGARGEQGLRYLEAALDHLDAGYLNDSAIALADRALGAKDLVTGEELIDLLLRKAGRLGHLGRLELCGAVLEEAVQVEHDTSHSRPPAGKVTRALGAHLLGTSRYDEALKVLLRAQQEAESAGDTLLLAQATNARGTALWRSGRTEESRAHYERARVLFTSLGERLGAASATGGLGIVLWGLGRLEEAKEHIGRWLETSREEGDRSGEARATGDLGVVFWAQGLLPEARAHIERSLEIAREIGLRSAEGIATGNLGSVLLALGRLEEARGRTGRGLEIAREIGFRLGEANVLGSVGSELSLAGEVQGARESFDAAISLAREIGAKRELGLALGYLGTHEARRGDGDAARQSLTESMEVAREIGEAELLAGSLLALGAIACERGDAEAAKEHLIRALETATEAGMPGPEVLARAELAALPGGDTDAALAALEEHEEKMGMADAMEARFRLFQATGDPAHLAAAHEKLMHLRDHVGEQYQTSILENVPLHRDIVAAWADQPSPP